MEAYRREGSPLTFADHVFANNYSNAWDSLLAAETAALLAGSAAAIDLGTAGASGARGKDSASFPFSTMVKRLLARTLKAGCIVITCCKQPTLVGRASRSDDLTNEMEHGCAILSKATLHIYVAGGWQKPKDEEARIAKIQAERPWAPEQGPHQYLFHRELLNTDEFDAEVEECFKRGRAMPGIVDAIKAINNLMPGAVHIKQ